MACVARCMVCVSSLHGLCCMEHGVCCMVNVQGITDLDLSQNQLGQTGGAAALRRLLRESSCLRTLNIASNGLGRLGAELVSPDPLQMWEGRARSRCRCGKGRARSRCRCGNWAAGVRRSRYRRHRTRLRHGARRRGCSVAQAHPGHIFTGTRPPLPHLLRDWAYPCHI
jgi:hypothetical protein